ncbi:phosphonate ABC transporter ATP-binding protein [Floricoccus penangensis]|uniref:phosphonate ABC transporter ATP-binding protein n=1 Tax=Floricoccus penangensis TaxID=1859475 RepID=UPI00204223D5|nr:phosphonate ABC transporter ATP-binding protein [Floricoccus penangensis]URZ87521.1 phosphonate ABC transporter ATP-binding protein [Floricoccus penangensis]
MIKMEHVSKVYPNGTVGLDDINLEIEQGEFVAIIGTSGAGKSTLIRTINRLTDITDGNLTVNGTDVTKLKRNDLRKFRQSIGMIFQSYNLVPRISVIKNVLNSRVSQMNFLSVLFSRFSKEDKQMALESLNRVGILDKAYVRTDELSGGQQQRVSLARTLAQDPQILLADEPVAALDPVTANEVMDNFKKINKELNKTVLINIHHVDLALKYADRIIAIKKGKIVFDGPSSEVTQEILDEIYQKEDGVKNDKV